MSQIGSHNLDALFKHYLKIQSLHSSTLMAVWSLGSFDEGVEYYVITNLDKFEMRSSGCEQNIGVKLATEVKGRHKFETIKL